MHYAALIHPCLFRLQIDFCLSFLKDWAEGCSVYFVLPSGIFPFEWNCVGCIRFKYPNMCVFYAVPQFLCGKKKKKKSQCVIVRTMLNTYLWSQLSELVQMLSHLKLIFGFPILKLSPPSTLPEALIGWKMDRSPKGSGGKVHLWAAFKDNSVIHFGTVWNKSVFSVGFWKCRLLDELWMLLLSCQANCDVAD